MKKSVILLSMLLTSTTYAQDNPAPTPAPAANPAILPLSPPPSPTPEPKRRGMDMHASIFFLYDTADKAEFEDVKFLSATGNGTGKLNFNTVPSFGIGAEIWKSEANSWGFNAGLSYEPSRKIKSFDLTLNGESGSGTYDTDNPKLDMTVVHANAIYRWENIYLPFGINLASPKFIKSPGATATMDWKGGVGTQIGIGVHLRESLAFELQARTLNLTFSSISSDGVLKSDNGSMSGIVLNTKINF